MSVTKEARPYLKWVGGKWALAPRLAQLMPRDINERVYREPFVGGGAMFFYLQPPRAVLSDVNESLVALHREIRDNAANVMANVDALVRAHGRNGEAPNGEARYLEERARFNAHLSGEARMYDCELTAVFLYLNKMGFNGLCRFNRAGLYNTPWGKNPRRAVYDRRNIYAASRALQGAHIFAASYEHLLEPERGAQPGDVVYLDPPYVPLSATSDFTSYAGGAWSEAEHARLAAVYRELDLRGCLLIVSNSDTPRTRELYGGFDLTAVTAPRRVAARAASRVDTGELVIRNTLRWPPAAVPVPWLNALEALCGAP